LSEHAGNVKITQGTGETLWYLLRARAKAVAEQAVNEIPTIDGDEWLLGLVNRMINSAPKPTASFDRMELNDFIRLNAAFMKENGLPILSGSTYVIGGSVSAAIKVFGVPDISSDGYKKWYFKMHGMACRVYSDEGCLELNVERDTKNSTRRLIVGELIGMIREAMNEGKEKD
jgi:hypothetical protein